MAPKSPSTSQNSTTINGSHHGNAISLRHVFAAGNQTHQTAIRVISEADHKGFPLPVRQLKLADQPQRASNAGRNSISRIAECAGICKKLIGPGYR